MKCLHGKTALITGAGSGIGLAFAKAYVAEGARVAMADFDFDHAREAACKIGRDAMAVETGVTRQDSVDAFFAKYEGKAPGQKKKEVGAAAPFGRMAQAEDLTGMAVFLASKDAD